MQCWIFCCRLVTTVFQNCERSSTLKSSTLKDTVSKSRFGSLWNNFALTFVKNIVSISNDYKSPQTSYRHLITSHLKDLSKESYVKKRLPLNNNSQKSRLKFNRNSSLTILHRNNSLGRILKVSERQLCTKKYEINPIIAGYRQRKIKEKLCHRCDPNKRVSLWWGWLDNIIAYFKLTGEAVVRPRYLGIFNVRNGEKCKLTDKSCSEQEEIVKKIYSNQGIKNETGEIKNDCKTSEKICKDNEPPAMTDIVKLQRKILCKKICNSRPYKNRTSSSVSLFKRKSSKSKSLTKNIDCNYPTRNDTSERIMPTVPVKNRYKTVDALYLLTCQRLGTDTNILPVPKAQPCIEQTKFRNRKKSKPCKPKQKVLNQKPTNTTTDLLQTCENWKGQICMQTENKKQEKEPVRCINKQQEGETIRCINKQQQEEIIKCINKQQEEEIIKCINKQQQEETIRCIDKQQEDTVRCINKPEEEEAVRYINKNQEETTRCIDKQQQEDTIRCINIPKEEAIRYINKKQEETVRCIDKQKIKVKKKPPPKHVVKWDKGFNQSDLLTCKNISARKEKERQKESCPIPCINLTKPLPMSKLEQMKCGSDLIRALSPSKSIASKANDVASNESQSCIKNSSRQNECMESNVHNDSHMKKTRLSLAINKCKNGRQQPNMKTSISVLPGQTVSCSKSGKSITITDVKIPKNMQQNNPGGILLRIRIRIPLSALECKK